MAEYNIRSLADLGALARKFFTQSVPGAITSVWANTFTVFGKVLALLDFEHEQRRKWLFRQMFASTADDLWLTRHAFELGLAPVAGLRAVGAVSVPATAGLVIPAGLVFQRGDGAAYVTLAGGTALGSSITLYVEADAVGPAGNCPAGTTLTLSPDAPLLPGFGPTATVLADETGDGLTGGVEAEDLERFRARVLARKRNPPQGGAAGDYAAWLREVIPTATGVWVDSFSNDTRSIWVAFTVSDQPNGIPTAGQVTRAQVYLDDPVRRPVTARVFVVALLPTPVPVVIGGLAPDTPDVRAAIEAELAAVFIDRAEPGQPARGPFTLPAEWLSEAISRATGEDRHRRVSPAADVVFPAGALPVLGTVSYTD